MEPSIEELYQSGLSIPDLIKLTGRSNNYIRARLGKPRSHSETKLLKSKSKRGATFFDIIDTEEKAYWLGFFYADGCLISNNSCYVCLTLQTGDIKHLDKFAEIFGVEVKLEREDMQVTARFGNKYVWKSLHNLGLRPKKSLKDITEVFEKVPENLMHHFIRGIFDGDGSVGTYSGGIRVSFYGHSTTLSKIQDVLSSTLNFPRFKIHRNLSIVWAGKKYVREFMNWIYDNATIYLQRKRLKFKELLP